MNAIAYCKSELLVFYGILFPFIHIHEKSKYLSK